MKENYMIKHTCKTLLFGTLLVSTMAFAESTPVGVWLTIDDTTHQPKSLIQITRSNDGTLSGKVLRGMPVDHPERICSKCTDDRKDQKIKGMSIIRNMKKDGDEWDGGKILDPDNGKEYSCKMRLEENGAKLVVRGYIGFSLLGRSQTWVRQSDD
ncbi:DUF2147 domain-containing protein [Sulfuricurvum sp.]|uniref:DUF2147 domain-containing protein n=1 Tax=Sulfuricurvum sp. TaxID=2025608 RepID=UPI002E362451|nr:DUF2147 domain-containing protein [Sulfuricurvum sp.]HEX5329200.1 DUF2147 domain-containing protein [Sulfuricurvum sp.]